MKTANSLVRRMHALVSVTCLVTALTTSVPAAAAPTTTAALNAETGLPETPIVSVIIAAATKDGNWGSSCYGLSAVRFVVSH